MKKVVIHMFISLCLAGISNLSMAQVNHSSFIETCFHSSIIRPVVTHEIGKGHYFLDFGKDAFGTLLLNFSPVQSDTLIIHLGEKTAGEYNIDKKPGGHIRYRMVLLPVRPSVTAYTIELPPDNRNTGSQAIALPDSFGVIMPFRYCEIEGLNAPIASVDIRQKIVHYWFNENSSSFTCSDTILNKVWELCKYTIKGTSFCGLYVDGDRERIPYEADALINQLSHYCVDQEYSIARRTNEYFITNPTWPTEWIMQTVFLFYYDCLYTGNFESLVKHYDALKYKTLIDLEREDGLISSKSDLVTDELARKLGYESKEGNLLDIVDWPKNERDGYDMTTVNTVVNAFHYMSLRLMSEMAAYIGKRTDSILFSNKAALVKKTINEKLFDKARGIYTDGENSSHASLHANMFPLAFDIVPEEHKKTVISYIQSKGMACSVYGAQFLLEGLYKSKLPEYAFSLLTATNDRSWWNMIASGSTLTMEAWDMKYKPNSDWNHAWGAAPANIITRYMWGIRPVQPGFEKAVIEPQLNRLSYCEIKVPTIKGAITANYKMTNNHVKYNIQIPDNMCVEFYLSKPDESFTRLNGEKVRKGLTSVSLTKGRNRIIIKPTQSL